MSALPRRRFTPEEYLLIEEKASYKSQYVAGEIFAMDGEGRWHVTVTGNLVGMMHNQFRGKDCHVFCSQMRVPVKKAELWTYPDVVALRGQPRFEHLSVSSNLLNPQVIFEVLSPWTESFDRGDKFARYRLLESLTDYVLVSPERMQIEHFVRQESGIWLMTEYNQPEHCLSLVGVDCELPLEEIYYQVIFPEPGSEG